MKQVSGKELVRILRARGWVLDRVNGSHHILFHEQVREIAVVPVHGNKPLKTGTLRYIMKIAGLTDDDL